MFSQMSCTALETLLLVVLLSIPLPIADPPDYFHAAASRWPIGPTRTATVRLRFDPAEKSVDVAPYVAELQRRLKRSWAIPTFNRTTKAVLKFDIQADGWATGTTVAKSSEQE